MGGGLYDRIANYYCLISNMSAGIAAVDHKGERILLFPISGAGAERFTP